MNCPKCGGTGFVPTNVFGVNGAIKCDFCDGTGVFITNNEEPHTNEEWFCQLPTEEKAEWLENKMTWAAQEQGTFTAKGWEWWLKQPHTEGVENGCMAKSIEQSKRKKF